MSHIIYIIHCQKGPCEHTHFALCGKYAVAKGTIWWLVHYYTYIYPFYVYGKRCHVVDGTLFFCSSCYICYGKRYHVTDGTKSHAQFLNLIGGKRDQVSLGSFYNKYFLRTMVVVKGTKYK